MLSYQDIFTSSFAGRLGLLYHKPMRNLDNTSLMILRQIALGIVFSILLLLVFFKILSEVLIKDALFIDTLVLNFIYSFRDPLLTNIMHFVSFLGGEFTLLSATIIVVLLAFKKHKKEAVLFAFTVFFGYVFNNLVKHLLKVPRPDIDPLSPAGFYSFPSGHAMNSLIFYGLLAYFTFHFTRNRGLGVLVSMLSIILIILIGFSRLYLGLHYPSDVIGGFIAGFWWLTTAIIIDKAWTFYKIFRDRKSGRVR